MPASMSQSAHVPNLSSLVEKAEITPANNLRLAFEAGIRSYILLPLDLFRGRSFASAGDNQHLGVEMPMGEDATAQNRGHCSANRP